MTTSLQTVLITGASSGIGAVYADRFARRGHPLVLVARDAGRMDVLAQRLRAEAHVDVDVLPADLIDGTQLARVESRLRDDERIGILVNNAGASAHGSFATGDIDEMDGVIRLNVTAPTRLTAAVTSRFLARGNGAIVNIASVVGLAPELSNGVYGGTKAYVIAFSQMLQRDLGPQGVYVQAVLPAATRTEIWERAGRNIDDIPAVMEVEELVDAALVGYDRRELITIPPLPDAGQWDAFEAARKAMLPNYRNERAAERYRAAEATA
jgi:short-subunit dehydrogenase